MTTSDPSELGPPSEEFLGENAEFLARHLTSVAGERITLCLTLPAPAAPLSAFLAAMPREHSFLWHPPVGLACAGAGVAHRVDLEGPGRLRQLRIQSETLWARLRTVTHSDVHVPPPRLVGGLSFHPGNAQKKPWTEFSDGCFTLPRWLFGRLPAGNFLTLTVRGEEDTGPAYRHALLAEHERIIEALLAEDSEITKMVQFPHPIPMSCLSQLPPEAWATLIENIRQAIRGGAFKKLVAARTCEVQLPQPRDEYSVVTRLRAEPECIRFAIRRKDATFLGASPELLFSKEGRHLVTQALAGTIRSLGSDLPRLSGQSNVLLESEKDRAEHAFVADMICERLQPYCSSVGRLPAPQIRKVRNILHLNTPITAELLPPVVATDLLELLHPTPAVGGMPTAPSPEWIVRHEAQERGWYSGVVGWMDSQGDAAFAVAIRSGVVTKDRAWVFTGAGIVEDSDADAEYAETSLKQLPLLRALGVDIA
jgi:isochorismate synthase